jgi:hypothetical protein
MPKAEGVGPFPNPPLAWGGKNKILCIAEDFILESLFLFSVEVDERHALILWLEESDLEIVGLSEFQRFLELLF